MTALASLPRRRRCWEMTADEFVRVPYVAADGAHPHRMNAPARPMNLQAYRYLAGVRHRLLPEDVQVAALEPGSGFLLLDQRGRAAALYHHRVDGFLLHVEPDLRRQGLGHRFLAACLDLQDETGGGAWYPGSYSDAGLRASLRAHRLLVRDAVTLGRPVPAGVLAKCDWAPRPIGAYPLARAHVSALREVAGAQLDYKEAIVVLALVHGPGARIEGVFDGRARDLRPFTFMLTIGRDHYQGFDSVRKGEVIATLADDARRSLRTVGPGDLTFRTVSIEQVCSHKHFRRDDARDFLERVVRHSPLSRELLGTAPAAPTAG